MAQLGARFHGMEEVVGSIPTRSTNHLTQSHTPIREKPHGLAGVGGPSVGAGAGAGLLASS